jgi:hypothetical protein
MNRIIFAVGFFAILGVAWLGIGGPTMSQGQEEKRPLLCGDVNGDGSLDITDAIYTLQNLFCGGQGPKCLAACNPPMGDVCDEFKALQDRLAKLEQPKVFVSAQNQAAQVITYNTNVAAKFDTELSDSKGDFNNVTGRFRCSVPGIYLLSFAGDFWAPKVSAGYRADIVVNVTSKAKALTYSPVEGAYCAAFLGCSSVVHLDAGDEVWVQVAQWEPNDQYLRNAQLQILQLQ